MVCNLFLPFWSLTIIALADKPSDAKEEAAEAPAED